MDTNLKETRTIAFRTYFTYGSKKHLHYLIQCNDILWVVERSTLLEQSELILKHRYENIIGFKVRDDNSSGHPLVHIFKLDGSQIVTNFISEMEDNQQIGNEISSGNELSKKTSKIIQQCQVQRQLHQKLLRDIGFKLKFGSTAEDENQKPSECLIRYGDPWKRIHNDQLVIGVPILNTGIR